MKLVLFIAFLALGPALANEIVGPGYFRVAAAPVDVLGNPLRREPVARATTPEFRDERAARDWLCGSRS